MLSTLADLRAELLARGFNHLDAAPATVRQDQYLNQAYLELCEEEPWPFLLATASGPAPLSVADLRSVQTVYETYTRRALPYRDKRDLLNDFGNLALAGTASCFYIDNVTVATFPVGGTLQVGYWKVPAELTQPGDTPLVPLRFRNLIVDGAVRRALVDGNEFQAAAAVENERQLGLTLMRQSLLWQNNAATEYVVAAEGTDW